MTQLDCSILIVSWNVRALLLDCLASLERSLAGANLRYEVIVVDNASSDESAAAVRAAFPQAQVLETGANLGYAGGVNAGLPLATGRWVLVLNPDTELVGAALPTLIAWGDAHQQVAVVGPLLRYGDGTLQSSRRRWPDRLTLFLESTLLERWWPANPWARRYRMEDLAPDAPQAVDWLVGAALLVRRTAIMAAGGMDERFWMYSEELEWQRRLSATGAIWFVPAAEFIHYEGRSSAQVPARKHIAFQHSKLRYAAQTFGPGWATALHMFLLLAYGLEWLQEAAKWLLGHKRPLRRERLAVYAAVLRSLVVGP